MPMQMNAPVQMSLPLIPDPNVEKGEAMARSGLNQTQWEDILSQEEGEETVVEIIDELLDQVMDNTFRRYIKRQLVPLSVSWAKNYLSQVLQAQFLCRDEGGGLEEAEDSEPLPAVIDSWASGCVPVIYAAPPPENFPQQ